MLMEWNELEYARSIFLIWDLSWKKKKRLAAFKHIDGYNSKERNQADKIYLPYYLVSDKKIFWLWFITFRCLDGESWRLIIALKKS